MPTLCASRLRSPAAIALVLLAAACSGASPDTAADAQPPGAPTAASALLTPDSAALAAPAPDSFAVVLQTSKGEVEIRVRRAWAPLGAARVHYLATHGFFDGARFFRVLPGFVVQFGLSGNPDVDQAWDQRRLPDEPRTQSNRRGTLVFATAGPDTRTTQLFVNLVDNARLDEMGFTPVGEVVRGMDVLEQLYDGYGEGAPNGAGPDQGRILRDGNRYLRADFPKLDTIAVAAVRP
jgi:peptidyl-prolyl cis-trans isomerase A (cyclophilin A)